MARSGRSRRGAAGPGCLAFEQAALSRGDASPAPCKNPRMRRPLRPLALLACLAAPAAAADFDLVLAKARVMDPESGLDAVREVGIREGKIAALSETPLAGRERLDVAGLVLAPGFIDLHQHGQNAESHALHVRDGVTTALDLEAGAWPVAPFHAEREGKSLVNFGVSVGHIAARVKLMHGFAIGHRPTTAGRERGVLGALQRLARRAGTFVKSSSSRGENLTT
jgi:hypothetical protein